MSRIGNAGSRTRLLAREVGQEAGPSSSSSTTAPSTASMTSAAPPAATFDKDAGDSRLAEYAGAPREAERPAPTANRASGELSLLSLRLSGGDATASSLPSAIEIRKTDYDQRLETVVRLGRRFPGVKDSGAGNRPIEQVGVWAGIYFQTSWQKATRRDTSAWWSILNYSLTQLPEKYAAEYESGVRAKDVPVTKGEAGVDENEVRRAWLGFFEASDRAQAHARDGDGGGLFDWLKTSRSEPQQAFWQAHCKSLAFAEKQYSAHLARNPDPAEERDLEQSWLGFVNVLDDVSFPTTAAYAEPILSSTMPDGAILGRGTKLDDLSGTKWAFTSGLSSLKWLFAPEPAAGR